MHPGLSDQQLRFVMADGNQFGEACPGAGKSRAIVARFLRRTEQEHRKGIGLLSFTTGAVDVVTVRCGSRTDALLAPHFVGTFDGLINRFVTRPFYAQEYDQTPHFTESWAAIRQSNFRLYDTPKLPNFELDWFAFDERLRATLQDEWIPQRLRPAFAPVIATRRDEAEAEAGILCRRLTTKGLLSPAASRALAARYIRRTETRELLGTLLAARFSEVIVDEAQDCGPEELLVLNLLLDFSVTVTAVADIDQSIYEFRRADPDQVHVFASRLGSPLRLDGNYRSSPAICALNNSLRHGDQREIACGDNVGCLTPVQVLSFQRQSQVAATVETLLATHHLEHSDVIFVSHRGSNARTCAGHAGSTPGGDGNLVLGIARASTVLRSNNLSAPDRLRAIRTVEGTLRAIAQLDEDKESILDDRWVREAAVRLALSVDPSGMTAKDYAAKLRQYVGAIRWPSGFSPTGDTAKQLRAPTQQRWLALRQPAVSVFTAGTIHSVKGREFPAVVVVLPKDLLVDADGRHVLDRWEQRTASELRRILYVGASRAEQLLILAVHVDHVDRLARLLKDDDVPYELVLAAPGSSLPSASPKLRFRPRRATVSAQQTRGSTTHDGVLTERT